ncbi:MAG: M20/M25/M40 family metallo-hydrolase [Candidatus Anstonellales archaeon]
MNLLKQLSEAIAPAGKEDSVRDILINHFRALGLNVEVDEQGNVIAYRNILSSSRPIVLSAHMDEIGVLVRYVDDDGFIRIVSLGGFLPEYLLSKRVLLFGRQNVEGVVQREFLEDWRDEDRKLKFKNLFIQTDLDKEDVKKLIYPGVVGGVYQSFRESNRYVFGKSLDDRIGLYILTELAKDLPDNVILMGSTEEEVSSIGKGAMNAVWRLDPRLFIAVDVGEANDYPGGEKFTKLDGGPEVTVREIRGIGNVIRDKYLEKIDRIATDSGIEIQYRITTDSATEASNIYYLKGGIPSIAICTPIRYIHTFNEMASKHDIQNTIQLLSNLIHSDI